MTIKSTKNVPHAAINVKLALIQLLAYRVIPLGKEILQQLSARVQLDIMITVYPNARPVNIAA
jgi:hypothetical protein